MTNKIKALITASGLSQRESASFLGVQEITVRQWISGRRSAPPGAINEMADLIARQRIAAMETARMIERIADERGNPETIEIGHPTDDHEVQTLGFPALSAWTAMAGQMLSLLPEDLAERVEFVPRGSTLATASAEI